MFKTDNDKGQVIGPAWLLILFVIAIIGAAIMWIVLGQVNNQVYEYVNTNYVVPGTISQANYDVGAALGFGWFIVPIIIMIGLSLGIIVRSLVMRGG